MAVKCPLCAKFVEDGWPNMEYVRRLDWKWHRRCWQKVQKIMNRLFA